MENQLIQLYLLVCQIYDNQSSLKYQRLSNFKPRFSDQELITIYLFGHLNGLYQKKAIYRFTRNYWAQWFPALPSYQAFNRRLNLLDAAFHAIGASLLAALQNHRAAELDHLIDSMPVMLAAGSFARRARVSPARLPISVIARQSGSIFTAFAFILLLRAEPDGCRCRRTSGSERHRFMI